MECGSLPSLVSRFPFWDGRYRERLFNGEPETGNGKPKGGSKRPHATSLAVQHEIIDKIAGIR
jgi:hypothetical protein